MEELSYEDNLKLQNSKEHLKVVLSNIHIASEELSGILSQIKDARFSLADVIEYRDKIISDNLRIVSEQNEHSAQQDRRENNLIERETKLDTQENELEDKITKSESILKEIIRNISIFRSQHEDAIRHHTEKVNELKCNISSLEEQTKQNEEIIKEKLFIKQSIENEITRLNSESEEAQKSLDKFRKDSAVEMEKTRAELQDEINKTSVPRETLRAEQEKLEILKSDLDIIKDRLKQQFMEQNPTRILPIELQTK